MKFFRKLTLICVVFVLVYSFQLVPRNIVLSGQYDWVQLNSGLPSLNHTSIAVSPVDSKVIYVGTRIGLGKTVDGGESWSYVPIGIKEEFIKCVTLSYQNKDIVYVGTYGYGIFISQDGGLTWSDISTGLISKDVETIAIDPKNPNVIITGTYGAGVFKTVNGGKSWVAKNSGLTETRIKKIVFDPQDSSIVFLVAYGNAGIFRSEDGGSTWKEINNGITGSDKDIASFEVDPVEDNLLYAGSMVTGHLFKSEDYGDTWKELNAKLPETWINEIKVNPSDNRIIYLATGAGIFKSEDKALAFKKKNDGLTDTNVKTIAMDLTKPEVLYASTSQSGIFKTIDAANSWVQKNSGLPFYSIICMQINPKTSEIFTGTEIGIYSSKDSGNTFSLKGLEGKFIECLTLESNDPSYMYAGTYKDGLLKSDDGGSTWKQLGREIQTRNVLDVEIDPNDSQKMYVATENGVYRSTDGGETWREINNGIKELWLFSIEIDPTNPKIMYVGSYGGGVFKTENGGESWKAINSGLTNLYVIMLRLNSKNPNVLYAGTYEGGVFKTTDGGKTWVEFNNGLENKIVWDIRIHYKFTESVAIATEGGVFFVENYGTTWEKLQGGTAPNIVNTCAFAYSDWSLIYAGTYEEGFFKKQISRKVTVTATEGGTISPSGVVEVPFGGWLNFTMTPKEGYKVKELYLGTRRFDPYTSFKVIEISLNTSFKAVFEKIAVEKKETIIILQIGNMNFTVNGETKMLDSPPIIKNGRTLLPIRAIIESLGGSVGWDSNEKKVTITLGSNKIELWIGKNTAMVNGASKPIDSDNTNVVPEIINGRTMLPVRFVTENLGADVMWDGTTKTITITYSLP
jgi:photosystem II stability/assembly factor-like uncharacterized protein